MPKTAVYVPFTEDAKLLRQGAAIASEQAPGSGCLSPASDLKDVAKLIIVAHSAAKTGLLFDSGTGSMDAQALARKLVKQGLGAVCTKIEVFACEAGRAAHDQRSFDQQLAQYLAQEGLAGIEVSAFGTTVGSDQAGRQYVRPDGYTPSASGSHRKATIDPRRKF